MFLVGQDDLVPRLPVDAVQHNVDTIGDVARQGNLTRICPQQRRNLVAHGLETLELHFIKDVRRKGTEPLHLTICTTNFVGCDGGKRPERTCVQIDAIGESRNACPDGIYIHY